MNANDNNSNRQILIRHDEDLAPVAELLTQWGFKVGEQGKMMSGNSLNWRNAVTAELPEGWKFSPSFDAEESTSIMDEKGNLRFSIYHVDGTKHGRELYSMSFFDRFKLEPVIDRSVYDAISKDVCTLKDCKTGDKFEIRPAIDLMLDFDNVWRKALTEVFNIRSGNERSLQAQVEHAKLWNVEDVWATGQKSLDPATIEILRTTTLDKFYDSKLAENERERAELLKKKAELRPKPKFF